MVIALIATLVALLPTVYFRSVYDHGKRLRVVDPGRLYRSGQLTADGFEDTVRRLGIRTVVNVQDDFPDPDVQLHFWTNCTIPESALCARLGVRFVFIGPDLISRKRVPDERPEAIDRFLALMDQPDAYPVLLHCKAGLHRTGCLAAVYRMEYQGWTRGEAYRELRAHGFGDWACTAANDYVKQYVLTYQPGRRLPVGVAQGSR
jgi:protein tyrosine phosphatase (PTP) superfamily phosphohydrolase (DUF442 family)